ncbi:NAD-dependent epimerase/dehydratase family protein [Pseudomonas sp. ANT_J12]|uniref:NAD-dependent epimerase/dehydratase family protein n=1 Tax=Pseudomonas sp. ANT_J12 TaxID=2597351 RepID=UPI0011F1A615|nr:NAD-dependent epimerase/dehydratase family protein [Pseudomonas sp. ANT_J12]KAA0987726.1 NAD-dependent epimerase/dehydratase family protein [Pseudomonas sp. ANT_J12]
MKILVTGASGFIGRALCLDLQSRGLAVRALMRKQSSVVADYECLSGELDDEAFLSTALSGIDVVIHLAGRAHQFGKASTNLEAMLAVNKDLTLKLASYAEKLGVKRFIFVSSIGVNGVETGSVAIDETSSANPVKDYALSKYEAEIGLTERYINHASEMELVIIRPPLVYAANAPGNFQKLLKLVKAGAPLPFSGVANKRSMVSLNNLTDFLSTCAIHPRAGGQLFLVSDGDDLSLPEILEALSEGMGRKSRLFYFPVSIMSAVSRLLGKGALMTQLCGSFVLNSNKATALLNWTPPFSSRDELIKSARNFELSGDAPRSKTVRSQ